MRLDILGLLDQVRFELSRSLPKAPRATVLQNLPQIRKQLEAEGLTIFQLEDALGLPASYYSNGSSGAYRRPNASALARALWEPPPISSRHEVLRDLRIKFKQRQRPTCTDSFFYNTRFSDWLRTHNFRNLKEFARFCGVRLSRSNEILSKDELLAVADQIWPQASVDELLRSLKRLQRFRPKAAIDFIKHDVGFKAWLRSKNFRDRYEFIDYCGFASEAQLIQALWVKPEPYILTRKIKKDLNQARRPQDAQEFFRSDAINTWLVENNFTGLPEMFKALGVPQKFYELSDGGRKLYLDYAAAADIVWKRPSPQIAARLIREHLGVQTLPAKPESIFHSQQFKIWLTENNFPSLVDFAKHMKARVLEHRKLRCDRAEERTKLTHVIDFGSLASRIWRPASTERIRLGVEALRASSTVSSLGPYRFFRSPEFRAWLKANNFRDINHFARRLKVPLRESRAADRNTPKRTPDWAAMAQKLGLDFAQK